MAKRRKNRINSKSGANAKQKPKVSISRFLIIYAILANVFFFFYMYKPIVNVVNIGKVYNGWFVVAASKMLNVLGFANTYQGFIINLPPLALDVKFGCNGLEAVMIYGIAVLAYPAPWKIKLAGIIAGLFIIQLANFLRLVMLVYAGLHMKGIFEYIHIYFAQGLMIATALCVFFVYLNYANKKALN
jgi:exosortase/archaeosortase family protein